jgi:branched-chain amino acid transport system permease protein
MKGRKGDGRKALGVILIGTVLACLVPLAADMESSYFVYFLFLVFTYIALAQGWNLVAGYTGQISLGQNAFIGVGAYVTAFLWRGNLGGYFDPLTIFLSGLGASVLAILVGIPLLSKLRGDYFALGTLGLGEILRVVVLQNSSVTGGSSGINLPSGAYAGMAIYYYYGLGLALFATLVVYFITKSRVGLALTAVRDDETAAAASGIYVLKYKVLAFAVGAFITGLCGNLQAYYLFHIDAPNVFGLNWTLYPILFCVLGAAGTLTGPIVGAFVLTAVFEIAKIWLPGIHPIVSGALIILVILFVPNGFLRVRLRRMIGVERGGSFKP